mmetsp:Transcript_9609/g.14394  ORF Transcript_9609/g.14394 Transcript_9609/m.14394 type:complete len:144 (+) Transcript_9609:1-432(+)
MAVVVVAMAAANTRSRVLGGKRACLRSFQGVNRIGRVENGGRCGEKCVVRAKEEDEGPSLTGYLDSLSSDKGRPPNEKEVVGGPTFPEVFLETLLNLKIPTLQQVTLRVGASVVLVVGLWLLVRLFDLPLEFLDDIGFFGPTW